MGTNVPAKASFKAAVVLDTEQKDAENEGVNFPLMPHHSKPAL